MNKIYEAFENKKALVGFLLAGYPTLEKTGEYMLALQEGGVDLIELSVPFSDATAGGKNFQEANVEALANGIKLDKIFDMLLSMKDKLKTPVVFSSYVNPIFIYGYDKFFKRCSECGIDGVIILDLPYKERNEVLLPSLENKVDVISMIVPRSDEAVDNIAKDAKGFIYFAFPMKSEEEIAPDVLSAVSRIRSITKIPLAFSCGVSTPKQAKLYSRVSDGLIVEEGIIKLIEQYKENAAQPLTEYVKSIKENMN